MKKILFLIMLVNSQLVFSQKAKEIKIMIVPSDNLLFKMDCLEEIENQKVKQQFRNYTKAFRENTDLLLAINAINDKFVSVGFRTTMLEAELKKIESRLARNTVNGARVDPKSLVMQNARNDIYLDLSYEFKKGGLGSQLTFTLSANDSYSGAGIASIGSPGIPTTNTNIAQMLADQVERNMNKFINDISTYFDDIRENGRSSNLRIQIAETSTLDLESDKCKGEILVDLIDNLVKEKAFKHEITRSETSESEIFYDLVKIPLVDDKGMGIDIKDWLKPIVTTLRGTCMYKVQDRSIGLGEGVIIIE